jgi:hypothetical protein
MAKFKVEFDVEMHDHSAAAHLRFIENALDQVKLAVGRGHDNAGEITVPADSVGDPRAIGSWALTGED